MPYKWDFTFLASQYPVLLAGLVGTLRLAVIALITGAALGLVVGISRTARLRPIRWLAACYTELFRNIPPLILLFWFFYVIPIVSGLQTPPFAAAFVALSLYMGAYSAEIVRAGIQSVERGQWDAARSIGFGYVATMRYVVLPQAIKRVLPALTNQSIELVKATALASTIAYTELLYSAKLMSEQEFRPLESYTVAAVMFIALLVALAFLSTRLERQLRRSD